jgi:exonuclease I
MIPTFEEHTAPLTDYELKVLLPIMIQGFKTKIGIKKCVTNPEICKALKAKGYKISEPRVRKLVFHIRYHNLVPKLIASSKGYWIATNKEEVENWLSSVNAKIDALEETKRYAENMLFNWDDEKSPSYFSTPFQTNLEL